WESALKQLQTQLASLNGAHRRAQNNDRIQLGKRKRELDATMAQLEKVNARIARDVASVLEIAHRRVVRISTPGPARVQRVSSLSAGQDAMNQAAVRTKKALAEARELSTQISVGYAIGAIGMVVVLVIIGAVIYWLFTR